MPRNDPGSNLHVATLQNEVRDNLIKPVFAERDPCSNLRVATLQNEVHDNLI